MSDDRVSTSEGPSIATILLFLLGVAGLAFSLTLVFLAMRSVMEVGGSCADGGPYVSAQPCPDNATLFILVAVFGGFGWGALTTNYGSKMRGPYGTLALLAWPALFCSLGFNFLQYGFNPPQGFGPGPELGFVIPGVMFELMGAVPLVLALRFGTSVVSSAGSGDADRIRAAQQAVGLDPDAVTGSAPEGGITFTTLAADGSIVPGVVVHPARGAEAGGLADELERLAALHASGALTDAEFAAAKAAALGGGGGR